MAAPLPLPEWCQWRPVKRVGLSKIQSLRILFEKVQVPIKNSLITPETMRIPTNEKKKSIDAKTKMTELLHLSDKDFKAANDKNASTSNCEYG